MEDTLLWTSPLVRKGCGPSCSRSSIPILVISVTLPKPPRPITPIFMYFLMFRASFMGAASFCLIFDCSAGILLCSFPINWTGWYKYYQILMRKPSGIKWGIYYRMISSWRNSSVSVENLCRLCCGILPCSLKSTCLVVISGPYGSFRAFFAGGRSSSFARLIARLRGPWSAFSDWRVQCCAFLEGCSRQFRSFNHAFRANLLSRFFPLRRWVAGHRAPMQS